MPAIPKLISNLRSTKASVRYEACEELRVEPWLPDEAIAALREVVSDADALVADAAQRALAIHTTAGTAEHRQSPPQSWPEPSPSQESQGTIAEEEPLRERFVRYLLGAPRGIYDKLWSEGPAKASIAASVYSLALLVAAVVWCIVFLCAIVAFASSAGDALSAGPTSDALAILLFSPALLALALMFLSILVAIALSVFAFFSRSASKRDAFWAFLLSVALLLGYAVIAFFSYLL
jgi:hypothetical protein